MKNIFQILSISVIIIQSSFSNSFSQEFQKSEFNFTGLSHSKANWVDVNNDMLLDIFITGVDDSGYSKTLVYLNQSDLGNDNFILINSGIPDVSASAVEWEDFDKDGDLDVLLAGVTDQGNLITEIYRNDMPVGFTVLDNDFIKIHSGSVMWIDYNNDTWLDVFITGLNSEGIAVSKLYRNTGVNFTEVFSPFHSLYNSSYEFYDLDNDGDNDVFFSGQSKENKKSYVTKVLINDNGSFVESGNNFPSVSKGSVSWGDFDADGFGDIVMNGETENGFRMMVMHNDQNGSFKQHSGQMPGIAFGKVLWADFDNDGLLDILMTGNLQTGDKGITKLYRNDNGNFTEVKNDLPVAIHGTISAGDFNNDQKLDILITGHDPATNKNFTSVYKNLIANVNDLPVEPKGLTTTFDNNIINFNWLSGSDNETPASGLTYNIRVGTTPGGSEIISPASVGINGFTKIPSHGNAGNSHHSHELILDTGKYYWSVQTIDNSFNASEFSPEESFEINRTEENGIPVPPESILNQNFPNPFNPKTNINYELSKFDNVSLIVYDALGRRVKVLVNERQSAGSYQVEFDGSGLTSGIYFYRLTTENFSDSKVMLIVK